MSKSARSGCYGVRTVGSKFGRLYMAELSTSDNHTGLLKNILNTLVFRARATGPGNIFTYYLDLLKRRQVFGKCIASFGDELRAFFGVDRTQIKIKRRTHSINFWLIILTHQLNKL
jgi:hypothetical protein